jgi:hypothetical protein
LAAGRAESIGAGGTEKSSDALRRDAQKVDANRRSRWHLAGGSLLAAAGMAAILAVTVPLAARDCNRRAPDGTCTERDEINALPIGVWTSVGAVALGGGITWMVLGAKAGKPRTGMDVAVGLNSLRLSGRF